MKTMRSKSLDLSQSPAVKTKSNKILEFANLYKSAAEVNVKRTSVDNVDKENNSNMQASTPKLIKNRKKNKSNESVDISYINLDASILDAGVAKAKTPVLTTKLTAKNTSTPIPIKSKVYSPRVKSIMKTSSDADSMSVVNIESPSNKPKKRNKSVSFMLEDHEELVIKKTKSNEFIQVTRDSKKVTVDKPEKKKKNKIKKSNHENVSGANVSLERDGHNMDKPVATTSSDTKTVVESRKKKFKKVKKQKPIEDSSEVTETEGSSKVEKKKTKKKKKSHVKQTQAGDVSEDEPATKSRKLEVKPEFIAENLENLSIGDNAHTLTNLLDEMTVAEKNIRKKNKNKLKKAKKAKSNSSEATETNKKANKNVSVSSSETTELGRNEEKEKVKWNKRKWNKDKKGDINQDLVDTMVIVENLPLKLIMTYKTLLKDHFGKYGLIKKVGVAEMYPTEDAKLGFTSTILFYSEGAASKALEEDNSLFEGSRMRIKKPLPPSETTLVMRSYAELTEQSISSVFAAAGKIRHIRLLVKGRKASATAFIEFDGPKSVQRALKIAEDAKVGGKKVYVSKFDQRRISKKPSKTNPESENEGDSENSNE